MVRIIAVSKNNSALNTNELVEQGLMLHQQGNLDEAAKLYQAAIEQDNQQSDALHLLGMIAFQLNQSDKAEQLILLAIKNNPQVPVYYNNLGNIYLANNEVEQAIEAYQQAVQLKQDYAEARFNLGNAYLEFGDLGLAEIFYLRALEVAPDFSIALKNLAELYVTQQKWIEATRCYESLYKLEPANEGICQRLSDLLTVVDADSETRVSNLLRALELNANNLDASLELANLYWLQGNNIQAKEYFEWALRIDSKNAVALFGIAGILKSEEKFEAAIEVYQQSIDLDPLFIEAKFNLANTYKELADFTKAEAVYLDVLEQEPKHFGSLVNLGVIKSWEGLFSVAWDYLKQAEVFNPESYVLQNNLGMVSHFLRNFETAKQHFQHALLIEDDAEAKWNLSLTLLTEGNFVDGFSLYECRWQLPNLLSSFKKESFQPLWQGENLNQKKILIHFEQGYGDAIQFSRLLPELLKQGASVILEVPTVLYRLMQHLYPAVKVVKTSEWPGFFDYHCPVMSLPHQLNLTLETIPAVVPYISTEQNLNIPAISKFTKALKIGIVWSGNPREQNVQNNMLDRRRSCDLDYFEQLTSVENTRWFSLQKDGGSSLPENIIDLMANVTDFKDTAEIINQLDLVISVDTAVAHLAGIVNKPVWLLSRYDACWRWLSDRNDSPWYPSMRIFRQNSPGDWDGLFSEVRDAIKEMTQKI